MKMEKQFTERQLLEKLAECLNQFANSGFNRYRYYILCGYHRYLTEDCLYVEHWPSGQEYLEEPSRNTALIRIGEEADVWQAIQIENNLMERFVLGYITLPGQPEQACVFRYPANKRCPVSIFTITVQNGLIARIDLYFECPTHSTYRRAEPTPQ